jgi:hypothetical protein
MAHHDAHPIQRRDNVRTLKLVLLTLLVLSAASMEMPTPDGGYTDRPSPMGDPSIF